jgi:hypothetical protein
LKRVVVTMSEECACVLKTYAALWGMTQSEVLYEATRSHIHKQAHAGCLATQNLLDVHCIKLDKRTDKDCYGYGCRVCKHDKPCRVGKYEGTWECDDRYKHLLSPHIDATSPINDQPS